MLGHGHDVKTRPKPMPLAHMADRRPRGYAALVRPAEIGIAADHRDEPVELLQDLQERNVVLAHATYPSPG